MVSQLMAQSKIRFIKNLIVMLLLALSTTLIVALGVSEHPRSFMFWYALGFCCWIQLIFCLLYVSLFLPIKVENTPTGATVSIVFSVFFVYVVVNSGAIALVWFFEDSISVVFVFTTQLAIAVGFFLIMYFVYINDLYFSSSNSKYAEFMNRLENAINKLEAISDTMIYVSADDVERIAHVDVILKKIRMIKSYMLSLKPVVGHDDLQESLQRKTMIECLYEIELLDSKLPSELDDDMAKNLLNIVENHLDNALKSLSTIF